MTPRIQPPFIHRCPVCHAQPSAAEAALLDEVGERLMACPRDPWCWCEHPALDGEGACELCGLVPPARTEAAPRKTPPRETPLAPKPHPTPASVVKKCREKGCGARVIYAKTQAGAEMIIDADPNEKGNMVVRWDDAAGHHRCRVSQPGLTIEPHEQRHHTHFTTCTNPNRFRKNKKK